MFKYKKNCFNSSTLEKLLTPEYTYKGNKPNTIFCIDKKTKAPIEISVKTEKHTFGRTTQETYSFYDQKGQKVGEKRFGIEMHPNLGNSMQTGTMQNFSDDIIGIGIRGDQIQIERALDLGITKIPREAAAQATLFHTKMGFLPIETELVPVSSYKMAKRKMQNFDIAWNYKTESKAKPIIQFKNGQFYLDLNRTNAYNNLQEAQSLCQSNNKTRINFRGNSTELELAKSQLMKWQKLIGKNFITHNLYG
ncbi:hypothetical protein J6R97_01135 [bacterium]|nr:hypothetical protein [bacterium]